MKVSEFNNLSNKKLANYLRSEGINTLPAEKDDPKACWMKWRNGKVNYQKNRIPDEDFDSFDFTYGVLGMSGPTYDQDGNVNGNLVSLDCDNYPAVQALKKHNNTMRLENYTKDGIITDSVGEGSAHVTCKTHKDKPLYSLGSTAPKASELAAFEVKADSGHLITFTKNGKVRPIVSYPDQELEFGFHDDFDKTIEQILNSCGLSYMNGKGNGKGNHASNPNLIPIQELWKDDFEIHEGHNRGEVLLRVMDSLIVTNYDKLVLGLITIDELKQEAYDWNQKHCKPPKEEQKFETLWKQALKKAPEYIAGNKTNKKSDFSNGNGEAKKDKTKDVYVQRFTNDSCYAEGILTSDIPKFLMASKGSDKIELVDEIQSGDEIIKPLKPLSYINKPYSFASELEVNSYIERAKGETLDSLYSKVKSIWKKYIDADDFHISICAADTIFTYYQNMPGMTHYLFFVGGPGSGKSNNLEVFHYLAYRNMTSTGITAPNIYAFYGGREEGMGTICEDEADDLDQNEDKMKFYKNGYTKNHPVFRQDETGNENGGRVPRRYFTYGWKAFAAERLPDSVLATGFLQRVLTLKCVYGFPEYDITEVTNPMGDEQFSHLLEELETTRKLLLVYRLLDHDKKFPDIKLDLTGREKQLFKPILRIFQKTRTQKELEPVISDYISDKRAGNVDSLHAYLYKVITGLIQETSSYQLTNKQLWNKITNSLDGEFMYNGNTSFMSSDFGKLTQNKITATCREVFSAKPSRDTNNRGHVFDKKKLKQLENLYNLSLKIEVKDMTEMTEMTLSDRVGLDKHLDIPNTKEHNESNNSEKKEGVHVQKPSFVSEVSLDEEKINVEQPKVQCPICQEIDYPYWISRHKHGVD